MRLLLLRQGKSQSNQDDSVTLVCAEAVFRSDNEDGSSSHLTEQFLVHKAFGLSPCEVVMAGFPYFLLIDKELRLMGLEVGLRL